jgi:hypothetical protein
MTHLKSALRKAVQAMADQKGEFTLFALLLRTDALGTWDLVVSAPWLESGTLKSTGEFIRLLTKLIGEESLQHFSRVVTLEKDAPEVRFLVEHFPTCNDEIREAQNLDLFGLQIQAATIFRAKNPKILSHKTPPSSAQRARRG